MFKVGDRVVANGFVVTGSKESLCPAAKEYEVNKTVLTIFNEAGRGFLAGSHEMLGAMFYYDKSELRYATEEEIKEADKKEEPAYIKEMKRWVDYATNQAIDKDMPEDFNIATSYDADHEVDVTNDCVHVELDAGGCLASTVSLEPQEARATAKALCEHADYVERMKEKAKPKTVFKVWKEGVKHEEGVVWLRLVKRDTGEIALFHIDFVNGCQKWGDIILSISEKDGLLRLYHDVQVPGIQTDSHGRIKEAE